MTCTGIDTGRQTNLAYIIAVAAAKFADPIFFVLALLATFWLRKWWGVLLTGLVLGFIYQSVLLDLRLPVLVAGWIAMTCQAVLALGLYRVLGHLVGLLKKEAA